MPHRTQGRGFTLIELLIVVAIIGIIAAILIPNLIDALQKAKQKRAMADVRNVGGAWFTWLTDQLSAAAAGAGQTFTWADFDSKNVTADTVLDETLAKDGDPIYLQTVPTNDPWGTNYEYAHSDNILAAGDHIMGIRSLGQDGEEQDSGAYTVEPFKSSDFPQDIVWADGFFVRWPEGAQAVDAGRKVLKRLSGASGCCRNCIDSRISPGNIWPKLRTPFCRTLSGRMSIGRKLGLTAFRCTRSVA